jgi:anthranilate synthase component 2
MLLLLDNFDSFTYNLVDYFGQVGVECRVLRNDLPLSEITKYNYEAIVLSPGPESPEKAGNLMEVLEYYVGKLPILGICLGHQAIGQYFGASLEKASKPMHGKVSQINLQTEDLLFKGIPNSLEVVRYHSLILKDLKNGLESIAETMEEEVMIIRHEKYPIRGIQYHPEAVLTQFGLEMIRNWCEAYKLIP